MKLNFKPKSGSFNKISCGLNWHKTVTLPAFFPSFPGMLKSLVISISLPIWPPDFLTGNLELLINVSDERFKLLWDHTSIINSDVWIHLLSQLIL